MSRAPVVASAVRVGAFFLAAAFLVGCASSPPAADGLLKVKLIAFNDFHGNIEPPMATIPAPAGGLDDKTGAIVSVPAGGAAHFATLVARLRAENPNNAVVSSGDMVGASPLVSALFLDEPTIEVMNQIGVDFNGVGNHEFDRGVDELKRKQTGGCKQFAPAVEPCRGGHVFEGARFRFLAANVVDKATGQPIFPAYGIKTFEGVKVGFIGLTLKATPVYVDPDGVAGVAFLDEATTINARAAELRAQGVHAIVVLIHQGGYFSGRLNDSACADLTGDILEVLDRLDPGIDVVASAHTHQAYVCGNYHGMLLTSSGSFSRLITDIDLEIDRKTGTVVGKHATNRIVTSEAFGNQTLQPAYPVLPEDPVVARQVAAYSNAVAPYANRKVGTASANLVTRPDTAGQFPLGNIVADAYLAATRKAGARIGFVNPGSVRAPIDTGPDGSITMGALFKAQPFGNNLITMTLSGRELKALLEQQWIPERAHPMLLQVSRGFSYTYDASRPIGSRVDADSLRLDGTPIDPARDYRVTVNSFMAAGGDAFVLLRSGREPVSGVIDVDALEAYFASASPIDPPASGRVVGVAR